MKDAEWLIIDTETTGLFDPIYVIEIAAQRMHGWEPVGAPFHAYLNHGVLVPPEATAVNGITTQFLRRNGRDPRVVHSELSSYIRGLPVVAHNLNFDWDRCLVPEWRRLSMPIPGSKGFCSMLLCRRVFPETKSVKLDTLRELFQIDASRAHSAIGDIETVVTLLHDVVRPRLEGAGFNTFDEIMDFSRATPVKKCHTRLTQSKKTATPPSLPDQNEPKDEWYVLDSGNNAHGPFPAHHVRELAVGAPCYIWREGIPDWTISSDDQWFERLASRRLEVARPKYIEDKTMAELIGLCRGVIADEKINNKEVYLLSQWLEDCPFLDTWPASEIAQEVEQILDDGVITKEEKERLGKLLADVNNA